jgi:hypothetical protein
MRPCIILLLLTAGPLGAAEDLSVLGSGGKDSPRAMLKAYLLAEAQKHFDARRAEVAKLKTAADIERRQKYLRAKFVEALGGFPD